MIVAFTQYKVKEIKGTEDNPDVLKYFDELGFNGAELKDETAWCSAFVNWVCMESGKPHSCKLNARSWLDVGEDKKEPEFGDVVVFWRESKDSWKGHVAFFICERDGWIYVLGGNQNNEVNIKGYPKKRVLSYRKI